MRTACFLSVGVSSRLGRVESFSTEGSRGNRVSVDESEDPPEDEVEPTYRGPVLTTAIATVLACPGVGYWIVLPLPAPDPRWQGEVLVYLALGCPAAALFTPVTHLPRAHHYTVLAINLSPFAVALVGRLVG